MPKGKAGCPLFCALGGGVGSQLPTTPLGCRWAGPETPASHQYSDVLHPHQTVKEKMPPFVGRKWSHLESGGKSGCFKNSFGNLWHWSVLIRVYTPNFMLFA